VVEFAKVCRPARILEVKPEGRNTLSWNSIGIRICTRTIAIVIIRQEDNLTALDDSNIARNLQVIHHATLTARLVAHNIRFIEGGYWLQDSAIVAWRKANDASFTKP